MKSDSPPLIVGISGASGAIYGVALLEALREIGCPAHLVVSKPAMITLAHETAHTLETLRALAEETHNVADLSASIASGSFKTRGMVIAPCSMRTLGEIASGVTTTLLSRAADVTLKERRRLVLMVRETPLHAGHLRNMLSVTEMGGIIAPPVPAFYSRPETIAELVRHTVGRVLDLFGLPAEGLKRWNGIEK